MKFIIIIAILFCNCFNFVAQEFSISYFEGTWKHENSETYEVWTKENDNELKGVCYKLINGTKRV